MTIYILSGYNNYYNRVVKFESSLEDYIDNYNVEYTLTGCNFMPNDGVNTQHVFGATLNAYSGKGDYLIVYSEETASIDSRWFIIDSVRDRAGQFTLTLRRDLLADYYYEIIDADTFIEKATLNSEDPLIYNSENFDVNQIFTSQTLLKDETQCPWFIGYYTKNAPDLSGTVATNDLPSQVYEILEVPFENWTYVVNASQAKPFKGQLTKALYTTNYYTAIPLPSGASQREYRNYSYDTIGDTGTTY